MTAARDIADDRWWSRRVGDLIEITSPRQLVDGQPPTPLIFGTEAHRNGLTAYQARELARQLNEAADLIEPEVSL